MTGNPSTDGEKPDRKLIDRPCRIAHPERGFLIPPLVPAPDDAQPGEARCPEIVPHEPPGKPSNGLCRAVGPFRRVGSTGGANPLSNIFVDFSLVAALRRIGRSPTECPTLCAGGLRRIREAGGPGPLEPTILVNRGLGSGVARGRRDLLRLSGPCFGRRVGRRGGRGARRSALRLPPWPRRTLGLDPA